MRTFIHRLQPVVACLALFAAALSGQEELRLVASDGQPLAATLARPGKDTAVQGAVVLLPMLGSSKAAFGTLIPRLAARGLMVLALDPRGHGGSATDALGQRIQLPRAGAAGHPALQLDLDVRAALQHLKSLGIGEERSVILGAELGASAALLAARTHPVKPAALVLLSPIKSLCGLTPLEDARELTNTRCLIVAASEETTLGAGELKDILGATAELRTLSEKGVLGTRMFGRVENLEDDLVRWIEAALQRDVILDIPLVRGLVLDGELGSTEDEGATILKVPLAGAQRPARLRIARNRTRLVIGVEIPERFLLHNSFTLLIDGSGQGPAAPDARSLRCTLKPEGGKAALELARGAAGAWKPEPSQELQGSVRTNQPDAWSAELSLPLETIGVKEGGEIRLAFVIHGQKKDAVTGHPAGSDVDLMPRRWLRAKVR